MTLLDFTSTNNISNWYVLTDNVMGGISESSFYINDDKIGVFKGKVRLENNGGFSSLRFRCGKTVLEGKKKVCIHLKGDGKTYQFRLKKESSDKHSYITKFDTSGKWETIEISLKNLYPSFRGKKRNLAPFLGNQLEEFGFLIGNKKEETFQLLLKRIELK